MWGAGSSGGPRGPTTAGEVLCASGFGCNPGLGVPRERRRGLCTWLGLPDHHTAIC